MTYSVIVQGPSDHRSPPRHWCLYNGDDLEMARTMVRHYTRPIDGISAEIIQTVTEDDGLGWIGQRRVT